MSTYMPTTIQLKKHNFSNIIVILSYLSEITTVTNEVFVILKYSCYICINPQPAIEYVIKCINSIVCDLLQLPLSLLAQGCVCEFHPCYMKLKFFPLQRR